MDSRHPIDGIMSMASGCCTLNKTGLTFAIGLFLEEVLYDLNLALDYIRVFRYGKRG